MTDDDKKLCERLRRVAVVGLGNQRLEAAEAIERLSEQVRTEKMNAEVWRRDAEGKLADRTESYHEIEKLRELYIQLEEECAGYKTELAALKAKGEPVAWLYEFDGHIDALMPNEVEPDNFKEHPEMYTPLYLHPLEDAKDAAK